MKNETTCNDRGAARARGGSAGLGQPPRSATPPCRRVSSLPQPPQPGSAELPITRIVLFTSGVGYFQREGQVDGNARVDLQFHTQDINDLLKSLVVQDTGGGHISAVNYDSRDPVEKTLKSFAINLTSNPSLGDLLGQVRGEQIELVTYGEDGKQGQPATLTGAIVGVQKVKKPAGKYQVLDADQLNLMTRDGLEGVALDRVQRIRFLKPELEQEFRKALEVLATAHDKQKKTVTLKFAGNGKRIVKVGYVTESPMWKTSYRLSLDEDAKENKALLQGWAIVENTTDEDWKQVGLSLISGRPISFQMDLYEPLLCATADSRTGAYLLRYGHKPTAGIWTRNRARMAERECPHVPWSFSRAGWVRWWSFPGRLRRKTRVLMASALSLSAELILSRFKKLSR